MSGSVTVLHNICSKVPWSELCRLLDNIKAAKRNMKKELLLNFMQSYRDTLQKYRLRNVTSEESFFPVMRVLLPALDKERGAYGVKEKRLADLYIKILGIKKDAPDALKLVNYRKPKTAGGSGAGDFAEVAYYVLRNRCPAVGALSLSDVDQHLSSIATDHAAKQHDAVNVTMLAMLRSMSATEQKWLIRVLLKDMQLGLGQTAIFAAWHPDAKDYYDVNNNLNKVCSTLRDPSVRLHEIEVSLFEPFRPMLAERAVLEKVETRMHNKAYVAENKFDGERSQIHKKGNKYMYFSRNGNDFTSNFGGTPTSGLLTPHLHRLLAPHVEEVILDGEVVCWHKKHGVVINKGDHYDVKNLQEDGPLQVCFCAFDLLLLNGRVLTNLPLSDRTALLRGVVKEEAGRVVISEQQQVQGKADVIAALNAAIDRREEGLVLKDPDSVYRPAARSAGWIKVKPDYVDGLVPELDLIIIGGYYGTGRLHGVLSHFLLGAADSGTITDGGRITQVSSVCRVGSGYSTDELSVLSARLAPHSSPTRPPGVLECPKDKPNVWFAPSKSVVLQVRAAEVAPSKSYGAGLSLRFPRVDVIRADKSWQDILTTAELLQLYKEGSGKLAVNHIETGAADTTSTAAARAPTRRAALPQHCRPADLSAVQQTCSVLAGKEVCVLESRGNFSKQQLEEMVAQAGGSVTQNPNPSTYCILCSTHTVRSTNLSASHNVIKPQWLVNCLKTQQLLPWGPLDAVSLLHAEQSRVRASHDEYGDSYTVDVDHEDLSRVMDCMEPTDISPAEMCSIKESLMEFDAPYNIFSLVTALMVDMHGSPTTAGVLTRLQLQLYGASTVSSWTPAVTHLICCGSECSLSAEGRGQCHLVTEAWVEAAVKAGKMLQERNFVPAMLQKM